jgi:hypothetical protein|tara:strand:- start:2180 stop:2383 length:204 start_codon:yes stop_codon:yes gene_type:complete
MLLLHLAYSEEDLKFKAEIPPFPPTATSEPAFDSLGSFSMIKATDTPRAKMATWLTTIVDLFISALR